MKISSKVALLSLPLLAALVANPLRTTIAAQDTLTSIPTYDPLVEPPLPANPTEYELGRNLYWHWCMTCHGDQGQGLTDEFRGIWEPDHQDCWARGCHAGRSGDEGFPIPTIVPALVDEDQLAQFSSLQGLVDYLQATHPPQSPGILKAEEYHAMALFVFTMNGRPTSSIALTAPPVPMPSQTPIPPNVPTIVSFSAYAVPLAVLVMVILAIFGKRGTKQ